MRILIADDEQIMLDSICRVLQDETDLQLETARNGREAIEKADGFHPELVMMDIKMPGINGLEALGEIRRLDPTAVLVILSAYDNFTYAQEAIRLDVLDYLLKPVNKTRLLEVIEKARQEIRKIKASRQEELILREKYKKLLPVIESEFLHHLINGIDDFTLKEYQDLLGIQLEAGFFAAISCLDLPETQVESEMELEYLVRQKMADLAEEIQHLFPCFISPVKTNPLLVFIPVSSLEQDPVGFYTQRILDYLKNNSKEKIRIGAGSIYTNPCEMRRSGNEAIQALSSQTSGPLCRYQELLAAHDNGWESKMNGIFQEIYDGIRFGQVAKVQSLLHKFFTQNTALDAGSHDRYLFYLMELFISAYRVAKESYSGLNCSLASYHQIVQIFKDPPDLTLISQEITKQIAVFTAKVKENRETQINDIVRQAKEIVDARYQEHLTLEDLSRMVNASPFYLCRLFREEMGVNFTDYLTKLRMEKSLILLAQAYTVKECCFAVGYNDPNYFSRIFRKHYTMTPSEYREEQLTNKGGDTPL